MAAPTLDASHSGRATNRYFFHRTGKVMVKRLRTIASETVFERERNDQCQINSARVCAAVERLS
jgi:hypothetical protein